MDNINTELGAVQRSLGRLEGKMDLLLQNMHSHLVEDTARFDKISTRQDKMETRMAMFAGKVAGAVAVSVLVAEKALAYLLK